MKSRTITTAPHKRPSADIHANHARAAAGGKVQAAQPKRIWRFWAALHRALAVLRGWTFYVDVSYYQVPFTGAYRRRIFCFRLDSGAFTDANAKINAERSAASKRVKLRVGYVVHRDGQEAAIVQRIKALFGPVCPIDLVFRVDMESGDQFAGTGNHSAGANKLRLMLADYRKTAVGNHPSRAAAGVDGYANAGDWQNCWPQYPSDLKRNLAAYTSVIPDWDVWYGEQYAGGDARWGSPAGWPRSFNPFGAVDCNVIPRKIGQILFDYGVTMSNQPGTAPDVPPHHRHKPIRVHRGKSHQVEAGESLSTIADAYNTTVPALVRLNRRAHPSLVNNPDAIQIGWILKVSNG